MADRRPNPGPILRLSGAADRPDAADAPFALARLRILTHELNNLLDGSLRSLALARRSLALLPLHNDQTDAVGRYFQTVFGALERMADLVNAAMRGTAAVVGSPTLSPKRTIPLVEALNHALDVLLPETQDRGVVVRIDIPAAAATLPIGPLYAVLLNALRNALESIARAQQQDPARKDGVIEIVAVRRPLGSKRGAFDLVEIEVKDDGAGIATVDEGAAAFDLGVTSKPGSLGIGLALCREVLAELGGTIELLPRPAEDRATDLAASQPTDQRKPSQSGQVGALRKGAVLRFCYPVPREPRARKPK